MSGAITAGTLATVAGIGAAGSIGSALIGSHAAGSAADKQMQAAQQAAQLQQQGSTNALNYQNGIYNQTQQNLNPYLGTGLAANSQLAYLMGLSPQSAPGGMVQGAQPLTTSQSGAPQTNAATSVPRLGGISPLSGATPQSGAVAGVPAMGGSGLTLSGGPSLPGGVPRANPVAGGGTTNQALGTQTAPGQQGGFGSLMQHYGQFVAPDGINFQNDPGYQERMKMGTDAIQRSAAARGGILTGGTAKALDQFGQDYASNEYQNVYNRALTGYGTNYGVWNNDNNNIYSRLMGLSGSGQQAANSLGAFGQESSNNVTGNLLGTGAQIGQDYGAGAAANASGIVGGANAWSGAIGNTGNNLSQLLLLKQLGGMSGGGTGGA